MRFSHFWIARITGHLAAGRELTNYRRESQEHIAMPHHLPVREVARANLAIALTLVWSGVTACVVAACVYDVGRWLEAW
jgi:hypothetical protein